MPRITLMKSSKMSKHWSKLHAPWKDTVVIFSNFHCFNCAYMYYFLCQIKDKLIKSYELYMPSHHTISEEVQAKNYLYLPINVE